MTNSAPDAFTSFGELLKYLRRRMQMTQQELGIALGYSIAMIARLENGERLPDPALVKTTYIEALGLEHEPTLSARLIELATAAREKERRTSRLPSTLSQPQRPGNLPHQLSHFIGRENEIVEVTQLLQEHRLVTLTGSGGAGKTRLAIETGFRFPENSAPDGVWLVELAAVADPGNVADAVVSALGILANAGSASARLINQLAALSPVLIIDNCEHIIAACANLIETLLRNCPHVRVLATSREALNIPGEATWRVPSLSLAEGVLLFEDRARVAQSAFRASDQNASAVKRICERLDGMPLALELAASRLRAMSAEQIAERLDDRFSLLTGGARTALPRQQTLRATIDWSYALLAEDERVLLQRLSVFAGGWTLEAAEEVCVDRALTALENAVGDVCPPIPNAAVMNLLTGLVDKSLVTVTTEQRDGPMRYSLLESIRQYAADKLGEAGQSEALRERHLTYFLAFAERADADMSALQWRPWTTHIEGDLANLRAALGWCRANAAQPVHREAGLRMAVALAEFWDWSAYYHEALHWLWETIAWNQAVLHAVAHPSIALLARALFLVWVPIHRCGEWHRLSELSAWTEACLAQCREEGNRTGISYSLLLLSIIAWYHNDHPQALPLAMESLKLFEETWDQRGVWCWFYKLHGILQRQHMQAELVTLLETYIRRLQAWGDRWYYGYLVQYLENEMLKQGDREKASALCEQLLALAAEWDDPRVWWLALHDLDIVNHIRALPLAEQYLERQRLACDAHTIAGALHRLGQIHLDGHDYDRAGAMLDECVALWRTQGKKWGSYADWGYSTLAWALCDRGIVARFQGNYRLAIARFDECVRLSTQSGELFLALAALFHRGYAHLGSGDVGAATADFEESLKRYHEVRLTITWWHPLLLAALAEVRWVRGQMGQAMRLAGAASTFEGEVRSYQANARLDYERIVADARTRLDNPALAAAWAEGQQMTLEQAVEYALNGGDTVEPSIR